MPDLPDSPIVSPAWLAERLDAPDIRVIDATWFMPDDPRDAKALFEASRIPGASFFDIDEISDLNSPLPHMAPPPEKFASRVRKMGVSDSSCVIVYDQHGIFSAARVWWLFRRMGHEHVAVLDGGFPAWKKAGYPIETGAPKDFVSRHFTPQPRDDLVLGLDEIRASVAGKRAAILDARGPPRFRGTAPEPRPGVKSGHMPGAINVPYSSLLTEEGRLKSKQELERLLPHAASEAPIVTTCGSGVTAAIIALALAQLGRWNVPVYDGSWAEWGALDNAPIVTGA
jgi:thiosulfate/3-mercaptopyruvate sulfurtransferase